MKKHTSQSSTNGEVLVSILKTKSDFAILQDQGWYRIPTSARIRHWPPKWLAFYQPHCFGDDAFRIQYFGEVDSIQTMVRRDLFPEEPQNVKSDHTYYKLTLKKLEKRSLPIISTRPRRVTFIPTIWDKFLLADQVNDLFNDSPLEDILWKQLKNLVYQAERQWVLNIENKAYFLDFAIFCVNAPIAVETDGDTWHTVPAQAQQDYIRQNDLEARGWHVLRFNSHQVHEELSSYCIPQLAKAVSYLGGISKNLLPPYMFTPAPQQSQHRIAEAAVLYTSINTNTEENLEIG